MMREVLVALGGLPLALCPPAVRPDLVRERDRLVRLLTGIAARASEPDAALLAVVAGGSGAGKSTLVNSLAGTRVAATGVLRPTTRVPTLVTHPTDLDAFAADRVLPGLARVDADAPGDPVGRQVRLATGPQLAPGLGLLDTPDVDSVEHSHHHLAQEALDAADVWVWLVTARSYADEAGMRLLRQARRRQALIVVVVTHVDAADRTEICADLDRLLATEGIVTARQVVVPRLPVSDGRLPPGTTDELAAWLAALATPDRRREVRTQALEGLRRALPDELAALTAAVHDESEAADRLAATLDARFATVADRLDAELEAGLSLRSDVLERWRRLAADSPLTTRLQSTAEQLGTLLRGRLGRPATASSAEVRAEIGTQLVETLERLLDEAGRRLRADFEADPAGRRLLDATPALRDHDLSERRTAINRLVNDWQADLAELLAEIGGPRLSGARRASTAINAVATSAILVLFSLSGGLTGGEVGIAAGAAATSQYVLTRLLGERALRDLLAQARTRLHERVAEQVLRERAPFDTAVQAARPDPDAVATLTAATGRPVRP